jgi:hypothetical protein
MRPAWFANWTIRDLVIVGILAALGRALGLVATFAFGGMNPLGLAFRGAVITVLYIILRHKVRHFGALILTMLIGSIFSFLIMAQGILALPLLLLSALAAELIIRLPGLKGTLGIILGVGFMEILTRLIRLALAYLAMRESPGMLWPVVIMSAPGLTGSLLGCLAAPKIIKELRHAGFINN